MSLGAPSLVQATCHPGIAVVPFKRTHPKHVPHLINYQLWDLWEQTFEELVIWGWHFSMQWGPLVMKTTYNQNIIRSPHPCCNRSRAQQTSTLKVQKLRDQSETSCIFLQYLCALGTECAWNKDTEWVRSWYGVGREWRGCEGGVKIALKSPKIMF